MRLWVVEIYAEKKWHIFQSHISREPVSACSLLDAKSKMEDRKMVYENKMRIVEYVRKGVKRGKG